MTDESRNLSRRKVLGALGTIGGAAALGGAGSTAFFSDREQFANNRLVAGELDMKVSWEEHYVDWRGAEEAVDGVRMVERTADLGENEVGLPSYDAPMLAVSTEDTDGNGTPQIEEFMEATVSERFPDKQIRSQLAQLPPAVDPCEALADLPEDLDEGGESRPLIDLADVKPGDFGEVTFDFTLCDNPGWVWLTGGLVDAAENDLTEPERKDPDEMEGVVELLDELQVTVWYDSGNNILEETEGYVTQRSVVDGNPASSIVALTGEQRIIAEGTLREVLDELATGDGVPLDGIPNDDPRDCFAPVPTIHYVGVSWALPVDHANEIQTDSVTFDLGFYVEQCRHNDGGGETPEEPEAIDLSTGRTDWTVTDPDGTSGPAVDSGANPVWTTAPCADWIDPYGNDPGTADPVGTYEFETTFDVAAGGGTLEVSGFAADNEVTLELDGTEIGSTVGFDSLAGPLSTPVDGGTHTLTATVENYAGGSNNPVGLLVCAEVTY